MPIGAVQQQRTVADPTPEYESMLPVWTRNRAVCAGERAVKEFDSVCDTLSFTNLLIPFSESMTQEQYKFYKAEAELPGIVSEYAKMLVGGLLRKKPQLELPDELPEGAKEWILDEFSIDGNSLAITLDRILWEEMQTSRCWIQVDYPKIENPYSLSREDYDVYRPYPIIWEAENVINWVIGKDDAGKIKLTRVVIRTRIQDFSQNEFHPALKDVVYVHELVEGIYQVRVFESGSNNNAEVVGGKVQPNFDKNATTVTQVGETVQILVNGETIDFIPIWPANGSLELLQPTMSALVDKEVALYNKISRRNHLLYGASTYTPWISSDMGEDAFEEVVGKGLGSWIRLRQGDSIGVLQTPSSALADMEKAIASAIEEMARMGVRMLSPETAQSGVALHLRNASQTAKLGSLNMRISTVLQDVIAFMLNWRYDLDLKASDVKFSMSDDFNPTPLGEQWLRLVTEWYEGGLIPRSIWLQILKQNDIIPPEYKDEDGKLEIVNDDIVITRQEQTAFNNAIASGT